MFKEGQKSKFVYIVRSGEFEMYKTLKVSQENVTEGLCIDVFGKLPDPSEQEYFKNRRSKSVISTKSSIKVCVISCGQLFGEHETILGFIHSQSKPKDNERYTSTVICSSSKAEIFKIRISDFINKIKTNENCINICKEICIKRENDINNRVGIMRNVQQKFYERNQSCKSYSKSIEIESTLSKPVNPDKFRNFKGRITPRALDFDNMSKLNCNTVSPSIKVKMVENFSSQKAKYEFSKSKSDQKAIFVTITDDSKRKETPLKKIECSQDERSRNTPRKSLTFGKLKKQLKQNKIKDDEKASPSEFISKSAEKTPRATFRVITKKSEGNKIEIIEEETYTPANLNPFKQMMNLKDTGDYFNFQESKSTKHKRAHIHLK